MSWYLVQQEGTTGIITQVWNRPKGHVMKWQILRPYINFSKNSGEDYIIAAFISVITLTNMVFVNSVITRLARVVVQPDCCQDYQHILCNTTQNWCVGAQCQVLSQFGDLSQCFPWNTHLKEIHCVSMKCESEGWPLCSCCVGGFVESFKDFSLILKGVLANWVCFLLRNMGREKNMFEETGNARIGWTCQFILLTSPAHAAKKSWQQAKLTKFNTHDETRLVCQLTQRNIFIVQHVLSL